ncbi:MAG TPA: hypothetical protein VK775_13525 [Chthoniobacterales bacterium]|jgi:hypothetical protein|nr:hypothetical protein [Chthoniobacterales bacterium]
MNTEKHPALLMVDTVSFLASIDYRHDEWGVDVTIGGSQKGLMLPPGLRFNAVSQKALSLGKRTPATGFLVLGRDEGAKQNRLLSSHAGHQSFVWFARGDFDATRGRLGYGLMF